MGLDMYLRKRTYVKNWSHQAKNERHQITVKKGGKKHPHIIPDRIEEIVEDVGYWRKANAIHQWFVQNVQEGKDDCKEYEVSKNQLQELLNLCNRVLEGSKLVEGPIKNGEKLGKDGWEPIIENGKYIENSKVAEELLPTTGGFFFGNTHYNEYYYNDIKDTAEMLTKLLEEEGVGDFYYSSSW